MINGHGNNSHSFDKNVVADFSSNVFNHPQTNEIIEYVQQHVGSIKNYPDCDCMLLRSKIANNIGLSKENILICNGSTEAFYLLAHAFKQSQSIIPTPSFSEYEDACRLYNHSITYPQNTDSLSSLPLDGKNLWLGNPNNPDGRYIQKQKLLKLIKCRANTQFIIDEAYIDLCVDTQSLVSQIGECANLILVKSFTKLFAIPGIRLGYVVASPEIISKLRKLHMPWAVNSLALKAGEYIVDKLNNCKRTDEALTEAYRFQQELAKLKGLEITPSACNYFLVKLVRGDAQNLQNHLMYEHGFLIRNAENFRGLNSSYFRLASQAKPTNNQLIKAIKYWLKNQ